MPFVFQAAALLGAYLAAHVRTCTLRGSLARPPHCHSKYFGHPVLLFQAAASCFPKLQRRGMLGVLLLAFTITASHSNCLQQQLKALEPTEQVGLVAQNLKTGKVLAALNSHQQFLPASVMKLVTSIAALGFLPKNFQFETSAYLQGKQQQSRFQGNLVLQFSGDPTFKSSYLSRLVAQLQQRGIKSFIGNVMVDQSVFAKPYAAPGWLVDNVHICYAAPISGLILDQNCRRTQIQTNGGQAANTQLKATIKPAIPFLYSNQVHVSSLYQPANFQATNQQQSAPPPCELYIETRPKNRMHFYGCMHENEQLPLALAVTDPVDYLGKRLKNAFQQAHIQWQGRVLVRNNVNLSGQKPWLSFHSQVVDLIVKDLLETSNNVETEAILKTLGHLYYRQPGTFANGVSAVKQIIQNKLGYDISAWAMYDGSGLSRYDRVMPAEFNQLLVHLYQHPAIYQRLVKVLPRLGYDGHLRYYRLPTDLKGKVRGKTGSMQGVSNLVTILNLPNHTVLGVSLFMQGQGEALLRHRRVQVDLLKCVAARI